MDSRLRGTTDRADQVRSNEKAIELFGPYAKLNAIDLDTIE